MDNIVEPKRHSTLESFKIHVVSKTPGFDEIVLDKQYGFTTVADLKRRVWVHHKGNPEWSPNRLFIAMAKGTLFSPLDMTWSDRTTLSEGVPNPFVFDGTPDNRLVDAQGNPKAITPSLNEGLLLETIFREQEAPITVYVWTLESIVKFLVEKKHTDLEKPGILEGYIKMYFPKLTSVEDVLTPKDEAYKAAADYIEQRDERLEEINATLKDRTLKDKEPFRLRLMRRWKGIIKKQQIKTLDILFYEFNVSEAVPFSRKTSW